MAFERLAAAGIDASSGQEIDYHLPFPKHEFLRWVADSRGVLFHGSVGEPRPRLDPVRRSSDLQRSGRCRAVYASPYPLWAMFFAILDKQRRGLWITVNGVAREDDKVLHWFAVNRRARRSDYFVDGTLYLLARHGFRPQRRAASPEAREWVCSESVQPLAALRVSPSDFPFLSEVLGQA